MISQIAGNTAQGNRGFETQRGVQHQGNPNERKQAGREQIGARAGTEETRRQAKGIGRDGEHPGDSGRANRVNFMDFGSSFEVDWKRVSRQTQSKRKRVFGKGRKQEQYFGTSETVPTANFNMQNGK